MRTSDFKTNECAALIGGRQFEPEEGNSMLGWRGASRYSGEGYREGFELGCAAIRKVPDVMGFTNVSVMIPVLPHGGEGRPHAPGDGRPWPHASRQGP